ncbi:MAG: hypothetical protein HY979_00530, partial [Candidatus Magasanikbacteria bacterium]|nr:hypothetical protein [Candidatus Magasanikbacteria bacterium]
MSKSKKTLLLSILLVGTFLLGGCFQYKNKNINNNTNPTVSVEPGEVAIIESGIMVSKPLSNDEVSSPIQISGRASS